MQLIVKRDQADRRGVFGGHKGVDFSLFFKLVLSPEELNLVHRYKFEDHPLGWWFAQGAEIPIASVAEALAGKTMQWPSVVELVTRERELKRACRSLKLLIEVAASFGGEEVFDIEVDDVDDEGL
ncbi:hypothetical protein BS329_37905 [Amycolatopsis coloradensis]|uniref:Uncharacterized protein n=1 Tax=Amycolatopsis coloradensis TaxID=76021 RepID=A0A1R0KF75_9PSEU|nr:hypothetical protein [Amycolatopsis coloradensis]OLZ43827.1 hypothetical protein BS329_37905 [Amycolatopsis coloradensis]